MYSCVLFSHESKLYVGYTPVCCGRFRTVGFDDLGGFKRNSTLYYFYFFIIAAVLFHKTAIIAVILPFFAKRRYTSNTTWIIVAITLGVTLTNLVSSIISLWGLGTGYVTTEVGNAVNVGVMSFLYFALLLLRTFTRSRNDIV